MLNAAKFIILVLRWKRTKTNVLTSENFLKLFRKVWREVRFHVIIIPLFRILPLSSYSLSLLPSAGGVKTVEIQILKWMVMYAKSIFNTPDELRALKLLCVKLYRFSSRTSPNFWESVIKWREIDRPHTKNVLFIITA